MCAPVSYSPTPHSPGKAESCLCGCKPMAPQCPDTDMVMRQTLNARVRVREVSMASGRGQGMRHGVRMGNGTLRAGEEGLWEPWGQGAATLPLSTSLPRGHPAPSAPLAGDPSWSHGHPHAWAPGASRPCHTDEAVALPRRHRQVPHACSAQPCPGLLIQHRWTLSSLVLTHPPAPCSGGLAVPQAAAAPCLPPSAVQHRVPHSPAGQGLLGHSHTTASVRLGCSCSLTATPPCGLPMAGGCRPG